MGRKTSPSPSYGTQRWVCQEVDVRVLDFMREKGIGTYSDAVARLLDLAEGDHVQKKK